MANVLSSDGKQDPDVMAANATSAALMLSDIPWGGPIGVIRIGRISGQFIINPTMDEVRLNLDHNCLRWISVCSVFWKHHLHYCLEDLLGHNIRFY